jgi:uncharacterized protein YjbJ (UPF0337 family)
LGEPQGIGDGWRLQQCSARPDKGHVCERCGDRASGNDLRETPAQPFRYPVSQTAKEQIMDREHVKGAADKAKGAIKEGAGKLSGDKDMETEGKIDKAKGSAHNAAGDVKDAARDAADALKNKQEG